VLMIEHHVPLVVRVCDYVYCLNFGRLLTEGVPEAVRSHPEVVTAYLGEEAEDVVGDRATADDTAVEPAHPEADDTTPVPTGRRRRQLRAGRG
jgi:branched-chain amino acid transport system ATP-binding protein